MTRRENDTSVEYACSLLLPSLTITVNAEVIIGTFTKIVSRNGLKGHKSSRISIVMGYISFVIFVNQGFTFNLLEAVNAGIHHK